MTELTQDEAVDRARAVEVESYDIFLDLTAEPMLSRTKVRFRWLQPDASTFAELRQLGLRSATLNGVSLPELPSLAISTPGLMVVNEALLGRDDAAGAQRTAMICAHEVAHLWFGALVGARWCDDMWLDEALASYLSYAALAAIAGVSESLSWTGFAYTDKLTAYEADALPSRRPVSSPVSTAGESGNKPYGILYAKGASVIRALAALIGDDALRRGLTDYLSRFAYRSAALDDLTL